MRMAFSLVSAVQTWEWAMLRISSPVNRALCGFGSTTTTRCSIGDIALMVLASGSNNGVTPARVPFQYSTGSKERLDDNAALLGPGGLQSTSGQDRLPMHLSETKLS